MQKANNTDLLSNGRIISLSKGNILDKNQRFFVYFAIAVSCLFPIIAIVMLCIPEIEWDIQLSVLMSICTVGALAFLAVMVFVLVKNRKIIRKLTPCLEDAISIKAYSKKIGETRLGLQPKGTKIQIEFAIGEVKYKRQSTVKVFGGKEGYVSWFNKYINRDVKILYSTKYDEVMIIKD